MVCSLAKGLVTSIITCIPWPSQTILLNLPHTTGFLKAKSCFEIPSCDTLLVLH
jgi:hypothetical protein